MSKKIDKLITISSKPICSNTPDTESSPLNAGTLGADLFNMLRRKNGFYTFESSLHVYPLNCLSKISDSEEIVDLEKWNRIDLWKGDYGKFLEPYLFFAEDIFGEQFAIYDNKICRFDPETAETTDFAHSLSEWAEKLLEDYEVETGYLLAKEWQEIYGTIPIGQRLIPKTPFILDGEYKIDNLYALDAVKGMKYRADIFNQIKDLPAGTQVEIEVTNLDSI